MSKFVLITLAVVVGCNAQAPRILAPIGWNQQDGGFGQQWGNPQPWSQQPWSNSQQQPWSQQQTWGQQQQQWGMPQWNNNPQQQQWQPWNQPSNYPSYYYPQYPQNGQQPWNNNWNRWPQGPMQGGQVCSNNEAQACFNQMTEYWAALQSIENNPTLTKAEVADHKRTLCNRLPNDVQNCYRDAKKKMERCDKQQTRSITNGLSSAARNAYNRIKKIQDNTRITKQEECQEIGRVIQSLNPNVSNELLSRMPMLRQHMHFHPMPYGSNQANSNPYNMNQNYPFGQFNPNQGK